MPSSSDAKHVLLLVNVAVAVLLILTSCCFGFATPASCSFTRVYILSMASRLVYELQNSSMEERALESKELLEGSVLLHIHGADKLTLNTLQIGASNRGESVA